MNKSKKILVIGELNVDILLNGIAGMPVIGKEILAENMSVVLGSSSAIFAANIAALGADVSFCGKLGKDGYGELCLAQLQDMGVKTEHISFSKTKNTGATIILNYDQDRANVTYCGAMDDLTEKDIPWDSLAEYDHVHISNFFVQKGIRQNIGAILQRLKKFEVTTSLDTQWDVLELWDFDYKAYLPFVDVFLPNESELLALTDKKHIDQAIAEIIGMPHCTALKLGINGSLGIKNHQVTTSKPYVNPDFIDAIGAGDSFNAGFILKYLEGADLQECLNHGNLMGSINTTDTGGTSAFANPKILNEHINKLKRNEAQATT